MSRRAWRGRSGWGVAGYLSVLSDMYRKVFGLYGTDQLGQGSIDAALALEYVAYRFEI